MPNPSARILARLEDQALAHNRPLHALLELTPRCNQSCRHCYIVERSTTELTAAQWEPILDQLVGLGTLFLALSGGEPLLHPEALDIIAAARARHFRVKLMSNLTLLEPRAIERLVALGVHDVRTTLFAARPEVHDRFVRLEGAFERTLAALDAMVGLGIRVIVGCVVVKDNVSELAPLARLVREHGALFGPSLHLASDRAAGLGPLDELYAIDDLRLSLPCSPSQRDALGLKLHPATEPPPAGSIMCHAGRATLAIDAAGQVYPCSGWPRSQGSVLHEPLARLWQEGPDLCLLRTKLLADTPCAQCSALGVCQPCPAENLKHTGTAVQPAAWYCAQGKMLAAFAGEHDGSSMRTA